MWVGWHWVVMGHWHTLLPPAMPPGSHCPLNSGSHPHWRESLNMLSLSFPVVPIALGWVTIHLLCLKSTIFHYKMDLSELTRAISFEGLFLHLRSLTPRHWASKAREKLGIRLYSPMWGEAQAWEARTAKAPARKALVWLTVTTCPKGQGTHFPWVFRNKRDTWSQCSKLNRPGMYVHGGLWTKLILYCFWWKGMVYLIHQKLTPETEGEGETEKSGETALSSLRISPRGKGAKRFFSQPPCAQSQWI